MMQYLIVFLILFVPLIETTRKRQKSKRGYDLYNISLHLVAGRKRWKENRGSGLSASLVSERVYLWCEIERERGKRDLKKRLQHWLHPLTVCMFSTHALIRVICNLKVTKKEKKKTAQRNLFMISTSSAKDISCIELLMFSKWMTCITFHLDLHIYNAWLSLKKMLGNSNWLVELMRKVAVGSFIYERRHWGRVISYMHCMVYCIYLCLSCFNALTCFQCNWDQILALILPHGQLNTS